MRGAYLEVLGDLLGSLAVIAAAVLILITGWTPFDAIASLVIVVVIIPRAWLLLREVVDVLLEATPHGVGLAEVREHVKEVRGVVDVHDLHAWTITSASRSYPRTSSWTTPASTRAAPARCWTGSANALAGTSTSLTAPSSSSRLATKNTRPPTTYDADRQYSIFPC
jgi:Cation efflux family